MEKLTHSQLRIMLVMTLIVVGGFVQFLQHGKVLGISDAQLDAILKSDFAVDSPTSSPTVAPSPSADSSLYAVASVTDGDTFKVVIDGQKTTVRIVGINTPETVDPRKPVQCFGKEASAKLKEFLIGQNVRLESDPTQQDKDRYGRLLRFVFLEDGTDVGKKMIEEGFAQESLYSKVPHKYREAYLFSQAQAQTDKKGLWADAACEVE